MSRKTQAPPQSDRPEDSPLAWFAPMAVAIERGDFRRATESRAELRRLGWSVMQTRLSGCRGKGVADG